ncbi:MAG TPA: tRNA (adenosine(37)-N6)-dimethylallyltransferase MiaA [Bacillota bacterium]|nr:tRNA (adenosine(37)-N6)-dimethylallyltransferase MiaA [Bacillota bacterium]
MKTKVVSIVGPTAVGKTKLSIELAKHFNGEIINGDSMQVYRQFDIGTAKVTHAEMENIPHHLIDIKDPEQPFSVADFQTVVREAIERVSSKGKLPIIVGGSGLYIQAALYDYHFSEERRDEQLTEQLTKKVEAEGIEPLYTELMTVDPEQAKVIHPNNHRRVIRALEVYYQTGKTMSEYKREQSNDPLYDIHLIGLEMEREQLYERINERVDQMINSGLLKEVYNLYEKGYSNTQAMRGIGYKELIPYLQGEDTLEHCLSILKRNSRRFAKRQMTWFKNKMDVSWYNVEADQFSRTIARVIAAYEGVFN